MQSVGLVSYKSRQMLLMGLGGIALGFFYILLEQGFSKFYPFVNGIAAGLAVGVAIGWFGDIKLGLVLGTAIIINLIMAAFAGALIPLALRRFGADPALGGGVVLTTVTDIIGFLAFLGLATLLLL